MSKRAKSKSFEDQALAKIDTNYFGLTSDWHIGSKYTDEDKILDYLDYLRERGIKEVFHAGDFFDGTNIYRGQYRDLKPFCDSLKGQIEYFNEIIPEQDMHFYSIAGNHDKKGKQLNQVKYLSARRGDIDYLGRFSAEVELSDGLILSLIHPSRNSGYPNMNKPHKYIKELENPPNVLGVGHIHKSDKKIIDGTRVYNLGTFKDQSTKNRENNIGGWIVELEGVEGKLIKNSSEWIFY